MATMSRRPATAAIEYLDPQGHRHVWLVGCVLPDDSEGTMRRHLLAWVPDAQFVGVSFQEDRPAEASAFPRKA